MTLRVALTGLMLMGLAATLFACNTDDEIADGTGGTAGTAGSAGSAGTAGTAGTAGAAGTAGTAGAAGAAGSCSDACPASGQTQCMGNHLIVCASSLNGCLAWQTGNACPSGQSCNSDGTKCVLPTTECAADADCGCGCGCSAGQCLCTGVIPPTCSTDADCGPSCYGRSCQNGECKPRIDPTCIGPCQTEGDKRCVGTTIQKCSVVGECLQWAFESDCPSGQTCNSEANACVSPTTNCSTDGDCPCVSVCVSGECKGLGAQPENCTSDDQCGPDCAGFVCLNGKCQHVEPPGPVCIDPCTTVGSTRCSGSSMQECVDKGAGCVQWVDKTACASGQTCNAEGTKCVEPANTCSSNADCGCGCGCSNGTCYCTGVIPPSCSSDSDCGPACAGFVCVAGICVQG